MLIAFFKCSDRPSACGNKGCLPNTDILKLRTLAEWGVGEVPNEFPYVKENDVMQI